ncbi:MAG: hypothetical protein JKY28_04575 [Sulfurimonas sp.]|nr:hypothetical protein [Sulfurimonas sp.]
MIGNSIMLGPDSTCVGATINNSSVNMVFADMDSDSTTVNSTMSQLILPPGVNKVLFAGLYWQGRFINTNNATMPVSAQNIKLKTSNTTSYTTLTSNTSNFYYGFDTAPGFGPYNDYQGFVNITANITDAINNESTSVIQETGYNGEVWVADIQAATSTNSFGAWALVVIYLDANSKARNITLFDGFKSTIKGGTIGSILNGFLTSKSEPVNAKFLIFGGEGDIGRNDSVTITDKSGTAHSLGNNIFNSSIQIDGIDVTTRSPNCTNTIGVDIDTFFIGTPDGSPAIIETFQATTTVTITEPDNGTWDQIFPGLFAFSTELYEPEFCYDYAYKQQGRYFTEDNNGTAFPTLTGDVVTGEEIEVSLFIKNLEDSDVTVSDFKVNILDINTSQIRYKENTVKLARNSSSATSILDSDLNVSIGSNPESIQDIDVGTIDAKDSVYIYYQVTPQDSYVQTPLNIQIDYNLVLDGTVVPYSLQPGVNMDICTHANFIYTPVEGMFNLVHNTYQNPFLSSGYYYNLPTQVTSRAETFRLIATDPNDLNTLQDINTTVGIELIDSSAFHESETSCQEKSSAINDKVWINITGNTSTFTAADIINNQLVKNPNAAIEFYETARENTAFRISYPLDNNNSNILITETAPNSGRFNLEDFPDYAGQTCASDVFYEEDNGQIRKYTQVPQSCGNASSNAPSAMTQREVNRCLECIYGSNIKQICSRDNFAIRPEAFLINIDDQDENNNFIQTRLTTGFSGVVGANPPTLHVASTYNYNVEVNASNFVNNTASDGYTKPFSSTSSDENIQYTWSPTIAITAGACDESSQAVSVRFVNGKVDENTSVNQVGEYRLNLTDKSWTNVDNDPTSLSMIHHTTSSYFTNTADCIQNNADTQDINSSTKNGCEISSNHINSNNNFVYNDLDVRFHPYMFTVNTGVTLGQGHITPPVNNAFIYMANMSDDENMSVQINTMITARGKNTPTALSNYVTGCYAQALDINISKSNTISTQLIHQYNFNDYNLTRQKLLDTPEINSSIPVGVNRDIHITTTAGYFPRNMGGSLDTTTRLNYAREVNATANPEQITFLRYNVQDSNNTFTADLNPGNFTNGSSDINKSATQNLDVTHFYARTAGKRTTIICDSAVANCTSGGTEPDVFLYYEVFCNGVLNGNVCSPALLPRDANGNTQQKTDTRWFMSLDHNISNYGDLNSSTDSYYSGNTYLPNGINYANNYTLNSQHSYQIANGLPYTAVMDDNVSEWLVYDENNASAVLNNHTVIFRRQTEWSGDHEADSKTTTDRVKRVNRRIMW